MSMKVYANVNPLITRKNDLFKISNFLFQQNALLKMQPIANGGRNLIAVLTTMFPRNVQGCVVFVNRYDIYIPQKQTGLANYNYI